MADHVHDWIYGLSIPTWPKRYPRICRVCGEEEMAYNRDSLTYEQAKAFFAARRCAVADCNQLREFGDQCGYHHGLRQAEDHAATMKRKPDMRNSFLEAHDVPRIPGEKAARWRKIVVDAEVLCAVTGCDEPPSYAITLADATLRLCAAHQAALWRRKLGRRVEAAEMDRLVRVARQLWAPLFERGEDVAERWRTIIHAVLAALTDDAEVEA